MLLDINVLIALHWENHEHYDRANLWLQKEAEFCTCPITQIGFGRICSQPILGYASSPLEAFRVLRKVLADPRHRFLADDLSCDARSLFPEDILSSRGVTDHYLAALAQQHGMALATFDEPLSRAFERQPGRVHLIA